MMAKQRASSSSTHSSAYSGRPGVGASCRDVVGRNAGAET